MSIVEPKQAKNLFNALIRDVIRNVFYGASKLAKTLIKKMKKSSYERNRTFLDIY